MINSITYSQNVGSSKIRPLFQWLILLCTSLICSCNKSNSVDDLSRIEVKHVIFIGLDGWGGNYNLNTMPFLKGKIDGGWYKLDKEAEMPTGSAPNWASIFMGVSPDVHGYLDWDAKEPSFSYDIEIENNIFPTIFQCLRKQKPDSEIGVFCQWEGIKYLVDTLSIDTLGYYPLKSYTNEYFCKRVEEYVSVQKPSLCAVIFDEPDNTGHRQGFFTEEYNVLLSTLDSLIQDIEAATQKAGIYDSTVFIVTSDHGGINKTHGGDSQQELMTPFFMWGKPIKGKGHISSKMTQMDIAPIISELLGLHDSFTHNYNYLHQ